MGFLSDNEERSQRVTSVASQTVAYQDDIEQRDKDLASKAENLQKMYNTLMAAHQVPTMDLVAKVAASSLSETQKHDFLAYVESTKGSEGYTNLIAAIVGSLGVEGLWILFKLPARMSIMEFLKAVATPRATVLRSVLAFLRERLTSQVGVEAAASEAEAVGVATAELEEGAATTGLLEDAAMATRLAAVEEVAAGSRFLAMTGWGLAIAAASFAVTAGVEAIMKQKYITAEHQACVARLTCRYLLMLLDASTEILNQMEVLVDLVEANKGLAGDALSAMIAEKRTQVNDSLSKNLQNVSYEAAWEDLHARDIASSGTYLEDELAKDEIVAQAKQAAKDAARQK
ncbi:hypothetical protein KCU73_g5760, partial [Aureobasidium melanogenum]